MDDDDSQLTLFEVTALMLATEAACGGYTADVSAVTKRDLRSAYAKLDAALMTLSAIRNGRRAPSKHATPNAQHKHRDKRKRGRRPPEPHPRRVGDRRRDASKREPHRKQKKSC